MGRYTPTTEDEIENYLCQKVKTVLKGRAVKYSTPGRRAAPDRLLLWPVDMTAFVECKRPGKSPTPKQWEELKRLWASGHSATWADTKEKMDAIVSHLEKGCALTEDWTKTLHEVM